MLDLLVGHLDGCRLCGRVSACVRVRFWDDSFAGRLCWDDFRRLVTESQMASVCRKPFSGGHVSVWRDEQESRWSSGSVRGDESGRIRWADRTGACSLTESQSQGSGPTGGVFLTFPHAAESRQTVLARLEKYARLLKARPDRHDEYRVEVVAALRDALFVCPNDILDRLLGTGRTDQPAPSS